MVSMTINTFHEPQINAAHRENVKPLTENGGWREYISSVEEGIARLNEHADELSFI